MIRRADERGFSLPELIMVIMVIAILAVVVSPNAGVFPEMKLRAAAERVQTDLRYAQNLARQEGTRAGLTFVAGGKKYCVVHTSGLTGATDPLQPTKALVFDTNADSRFSGITFGWSLPGGGSNLLFDSLGQPRDAAYAVAGTAATVTLSLNGQTATLTVEPITGRVSDVVLS